LNYSTTRTPNSLLEASSRPSTPAIKTLVVDDDRTSLELMGRLLQRAGHIPLLADSAERALTLFHENQPDIVLMDIVLPGMDGREAMRRMKEARKDGWLPVILVSVKDTAAEVLQGLREGADDYLTKPLRVEPTLAKIRNLARSLQAQRELKQSLQLTRAIMDHIGEALLCCDERGVVRASNHAAEQLFGYEAGELPGLHVSTLLPDTSGSVRPPPGGVIEVLGCGRARDGRVFSIEARHSTVCLADHQLVVYTIRDVTERLREERRALNDAARLMEYKDAREHENLLAREMLDKLLHRDRQQPTNVHFTSEAATGFSGDAVAALRAPDGKLFVFLADATGHGLAAAISLVPALSVLHAMVERGCALRAIVAELHDKLQALMPVGRFLAACLICLDEEARTGEIWSGGMPPVLLLSIDGRPQQRFEAEHLALGIVPCSPEVSTTRSFTWHRGEQLILATDGVLEAENINGEQFGEARLVGHLEAASASERIESVKRALGEHLSGLPLGDDASLVCLDLL